jgi:hypothetical protein
MGRLPLRRNAGCLFWRAMWFLLIFGVAAGVLYWLLSRRHGWLFYEHLVAPTDGAQAIAMLEMRRRQGASYFLITEMEEDLRGGSYLSFWCYLETHFKKISSTAEFTIFDLNVARGALRDSRSSNRLPRDAKVTWGDAFTYGVANWIGTLVNATIAPATRSHSAR